ncbi:glycosyltransferase family 9 protein [Nitratidesulfovibrio termitidis]|uniref:glycosyltransferase family 9 protein n=1 Tax=Nitratidesulfovibrio termitidis TaxID=42252 RepID=UPI00041D4A68|nr:glycosyltransferase family 9 protein [Nitratidesulfovibrio termitidis]
MKSDKLIAVHNGALGDFLCAWPALLALARGADTLDMKPGGAGTEHAAAQGCAPRLLFTGNMERMRWLAPLGYVPCPPAMRRALDGLYGGTDGGRNNEGGATRGGTDWPDALAGATVAWFCLDRAPVAAHPRVVPLPCLTAGPDMPDMPDMSDMPDMPDEGDADADGRTSEPAMPTCHVTESLRTRLQRIPPSALPCPPRWDADWQDTWQTLFGGWEGADSRTVVLVPGAGHRSKQWPPRRFALVAGALFRAGYNPLYVLGPAELERGLERADLMPEGQPEAEEIPVVTPADHDALAHLLRRARLVIGNDSGPLHLAALHGVPVLSLFGPAPAGVWRPHGAAALVSPLECAPCSATLRTLGCDRGQGNASPHGEKSRNGTADSDGAFPCMAAITVQEVLDKSMELLGIPFQQEKWTQRP